MHIKVADRNIVIGAAIGGVVLVGLSFFGGMKYAEMSRVSRFTQGGPGGAQGTGRTIRFSSGGAAFGKILSKDDTGITIQLQGGPGANATSQGTGSKIILVNTSTQIQKSTSGTSADLTEGQTVMIQGTQNNDGSITAQNIQIRPEGGGFQRPASPTTQ